MEYIPDLVTQAYRNIGYDVSNMYDDVTEIQRTFCQKWGGFRYDTFCQAVENGEGEEVILAMTLVYALNPDWLRQYFVTTEKQAEYWRRWGFGLVMGKAQDLLAFPLVCELLTDGLSWQEFYRECNERSGEEYNKDLLQYYWRIYITQNLRDYGKEEAVPYFRNGLLKSLSFYKQLQELGETDPRSDLTSFQLHISYALGKLGGGGALSGILSDYLPMWQVVSCAGALDRTTYALHAYDTSLRFIEKKWDIVPAIREALIQRLKHRFGYDEEVGKRILYEDRYVLSNAPYILSYFEPMVERFTTKHYHQEIIQQWTVLEQ